LLPVPLPPRSAGGSDEPGQRRGHAVAPDQAGRVVRATNALQTPRGHLCCRSRPNGGGKAPSAADHDHELHQQAEERLPVVALSTLVSVSAANEKRVL